MTRQIKNRDTCFFYPTEVLVHFITNGKNLYAKIPNIFQVCILLQACTKTSWAHTFARRPLLRVSITTNVSEFLVTKSIFEKGVAKALEKTSHMCLTSDCRLSLDKADIEVANAADADEVLLMGALSAKWTNNDAIDKVHSTSE